ncbi:two-component system, LytT family, sensor histidine kinase LytS [Carnobacterium alterfunditum]|uniref:histidine kinase n=1 Tax=Carnobacterium alterfunditum TaxID=28230 RepID=A0A1N6ENT8_9LACT|nr:sensor histidine kinase [Carnobacterium alterfunditum]SIN84759.1 two-component system, LytT family, sensor histidine kinase LytS [Carnobacterium alterfunditum]
MFYLFILMLERGGLIIILAYILMNIPYFKNLLGNRRKASTMVQLIVVFGLFALISNFTGVEIGQNQIKMDQPFTDLSSHSSLANTRVLTIGVSGLIGGPIIGVGVGLISGIIRYFQGGIDAYVYVISSILVGLFSGVYGLKSIRKNAFPKVREGLIIGAAMEVVQMMCILLLSSYFQEAVDLVKFIGLPMILTNSIGTGIFLSIIDSTLRQEEQTRAVQTHDVFQLANETMPYFRSGMNEESCTQAAKIIQKLIKVSAVSITNKDSILAHVGAASDHHVPSKKIVTNLSKEVLRTGEIKEVHSHQEIGCDHPDCPLEAAIVIPLKSQGKTVGTLKMYFTDASKLTFVERQLAEGLATIFSSQIELGEMELQSQLLQDAEIKSLQAQVNPHFFFNTINTISALIRIDSEKAREMLLQLSTFFRSNLQGARTNVIPLEKELLQVEAYTKLEQARFPDRYQIEMNIENGLNNILLPPFMIQILVENAFKHAFRNRRMDNLVQVTVNKIDNDILVSVQDNGYGIEKNRLGKLGKESVSSERGTGSALENLNKRLISLFGDRAKLNFESSEKGTIIICKIPYQGMEG